MKQQTTQSWKHKLFLNRSTKQAYMVFVITTSLTELEISSTSHNTVLEALGHQPRTLDRYLIIPHRRRKKRAKRSKLAITRRCTIDKAARRDSLALAQGGRHEGRLLLLLLLLCQPRNFYQSRSRDFRCELGQPMARARCEKIPREILSPGDFPP